MGGDVRGRVVSDVAIEGLYIELVIYEVKTRLPGDTAARGITTTTFDLLAGVDTYDANVIRVLENLQRALGSEPEQALLMTDEVEG